MNKTLENMELVLEKIQTELKFDTKDFRFVKTLTNTYRILLDKFRISLSNKEIKQYENNLLEHKATFSTIQSNAENELTSRITNGDYISANILAEINRRLEYSKIEIDNIIKDPLELKGWRKNKQNN